MSLRVVELKPFVPARDFALSRRLLLLVEDLAAWHERIASTGLAEKYGVRQSQVMQQPWGMRDFTLWDPSGVLWRIGQNT